MTATKTKERAETHGTGNTQRSVLDDQEYEKRTCVCVCACVCVRVCLRKLRDSGPSILPYQEVFLTLRCSMVEFFFSFFVISCL
jgi:hypothetical protein